MTKDHYYYSVYPRVYEAGKPGRVTVKPKGRHAAFVNAEYYVTVIPLSTINDRFTADSPPEFICPYLTIKPENGVLAFDYVFESEQQYSLVIYDTSNRAKPLAQLDVYCVENDLINLKPYKTETHCHTNNSDGAESVEFVPRYYRRYGFDTLAITDHGKYKPSIEAMEAFKGMPSDFALFPGEEVHAPRNPIHIINFGGENGVSEIFQNDRALYNRQVNEIINETYIPAEFDPYRVASCIWVSREIRKAGGLCILGHPGWQSAPAKAAYNDADNKNSLIFGGCLQNYSVPLKMTLYLLETGIFDAWEIFGFSQLRNNRHINIYLEAARKGINIPAVGANDSHGVVVNTEWFNKAHTIVFAKNNTRGEMLSRLKNGFCAAVQDGRGDEANGRLVIGGSRFMDYALFLLENYYDDYREYCLRESVAMAGYLNGAPDADVELAGASCATEVFKKHFFEGL